jgi:MFS family permease
MFVSALAYGAGNVVANVLIPALSLSNVRRGVDSFAWTAIFASQSIGAVIWSFVADRWSTQITLGGASSILALGILSIGIVFIKNGNGFA